MSYTPNAAQLTAHIEPCAKNLMATLLTNITSRQSRVLNNYDHAAFVDAIGSLRSDSPEYMRQVKALTADYNYTNDKYLLVCAVAYHTIFTALEVGLTVDAVAWQTKYNAKQADMTCMSKFVRELSKVRHLYTTDPTDNYDLLYDVCINQAYQVSYAHYTLTHVFEHLSATCGPRIKNMALPVQYDVNYLDTLLNRLMDKDKLDMPYTGSNLTVFGLIMSLLTMTAAVVVGLRGLNYDLNKYNVDKAYTRVVQGSIKVLLREDMSPYVNEMAKRTYEMLKDHVVADDVDVAAMLGAEGQITALREMYEKILVDA